MIDIDHQRTLRTKRTQGYVLAVVFLSCVVCNTVGISGIATAVMAYCAIASFLYAASCAADLHRMKLRMDKTKGGRMR